jgi:hypothetical protein
LERHCVRMLEACPHLLCVGAMQNQVLRNF